jgi:hypothetical protein
MHAKAHLKVLLVQELLLLKSLLVEARNLTDNVFVHRNTAW